MIKEGRKHSEDPAQEQLRQSKDNWNAQVKGFIADLIQFKKLMNGSPSKYNKVKSKITQPIPSNPGTVLQQLSGRFQEIAQGGNEIVEQQVYYSQHHRMPKPKQPNAPQTPQAPQTPEGAPPTAADLSKQLAASLENKYELVAEGSNPFSRFFTRMTTRTRGSGPEADKRRLRMEMLDEAVTAYKLIGKFQVQIVSSDDESSENAHKIIKEAFRAWSLLNRKWQDFMRVSALSAETAKPAPAKPVPAAAKPVETAKPVEVVEPVKTEPTKPAKAPKPEEATTAELTAARDTVDQLEAVAQDFLKRWLGERKQQYMPGKKSSTRLQLFRKGQALRKKINLVLDMLEKSLDGEMLGPAISEIAGEISNLNTMARLFYMTDKPDKTRDMKDEGLI